MYKDMKLPKNVSDVMSDASHYELMPEGFNVYSWSPEPAGDAGPLTQVHMYFSLGTQVGKGVVRFKSTNTLDRLIAALIEHRQYVWPTASPQPELVTALNNLSSMKR